jgi:regulatory protein
LSYKTYTLAEAKRKLEHYCVYQDRCHKEIIKKLRDMNMIQLAVDEIISHLIEHNFLNEERFAKNFARGKFNIKHWGRQRITKELKFREISTYNIKAALQEFSEEDYYYKLNELALKKLDTIKESDKYKKRKKLADYLLYRGWESHLVYEKTKELIP